MHTPADKTFPPPDYSKFLPFYDVFREVERLCEQRNFTVNWLRADEGRLSRLETQLRNLGFRRFGPEVHKGSYAIVFEGNERQMLRIVNSESAETRPKDMDVLQPMLRVDFNGSGVVEILPKVHTLFDIIETPELSKQYGITREGAAQILRQLVIDNLHYDRIFFDCAPQNVGIIKDPAGNNVPVIIDPGVVIDPIQLTDIMNKATGLRFIDVLKVRLAHDFSTRHFQDRAAADFSTYEAMKGPDVAVFSTLRDLGKEPASNHDYVGAQKHHMKQLGLEYGKTSNTIGMIELKKFADERLYISGVRPHKKIDGRMQPVGEQLAKDYDPMRSTWGQMVNGDGLYRNEIAEIVRAAGQDENPNVGFCTKIKEAAAAYKGTGKS
jgi:hypothetical protein